MVFSEISIIPSVSKVWDNSRTETKRKQTNLKVTGEYGKEKVIRDRVWKSQEIK